MCPLSRLAQGSWDVGNGVPSRVTKVLGTCGAGLFITQPIHNIQYLQMAPKLAVIYQVGGTIKFNIQREDLEQEQSCPESFHSTGPLDGWFD